MRAAVAPSPAAEAACLLDPARTSPAANKPGSEVIKVLKASRYLQKTTPANTSEGSNVRKHLYDASRSINNEEMHEHGDKHVCPKERKSSK
jgi:hypothetical protein